MYIIWQQTVKSAEKHVRSKKINPSINEFLLKGGKYIEFIKLFASFSFIDCCFFTD
jgi:hypothetical protein